MAARKKRPAEERFLEKVDQSGDCWLWTAPVQDDGYARFWLNGRLDRAHRAAYLLFVGPIPVGLELDHVCHTRDASCPGGSDCPHRRCVRPDHLEAVDQPTNALRSRSFAAMNALKTHCPQNHPYDDSNTYVNPKGKRTCRTCKAAGRTSAHPRSESMPRTCLRVLGSIGGSASTSEVLRQLRAEGGQPRPVHVTTALGRLASREQPLVAKTRQGISGGGPSVWEITAAGRLLLARE